MKGFIRILAVAAAAWMSSAAAEPPGLIVHAPAGAARGKTLGDLHVFKGLPYALPPVGSRRWRPPAPMPTWGGVFEATDFGPVCYQPANDSRSIYAWKDLPTSEDCLTLNIWAPAHAAHAPVFFWIHGGSALAVPAHPLYDGKRRRLRPRRRVDQLPPRRARLAGASRAERRIAAAPFWTITACSNQHRRAAMGARNIPHPVATPPMSPSPANPPAPSASCTSSRPRCARSVRQGNQPERRHDLNARNRGACSARLPPRPRADASVKAPRGAMSHAPRHGPANMTNVAARLADFRQGPIMMTYCLTRLFTPLIDGEQANAPCWWASTAAKLSLRTSDPSRLRRHL